MSNFEIHRAQVSDRQQLLDTANKAFTTPEVLCDFERKLPHLFTDKRIPNHFIAVAHNQVIGIVGCYEFELLIAGVRFNIAGIGQVSCLPEARGQGVMSQLLKSCCDYLDHSDIDFAYLYGDRQRYGRYGWAKGGYINHFESYDKYLPTIQGTHQISDIDKIHDAQFIYDRIIKTGYGMCMDIDEFKSMLQSTDIGGERLNESFILHNSNGENIQIASGNEEEIEQLLINRCKVLRNQEGDKWKFAIEAPRSNNLITRIMKKYYWNHSFIPQASFRICNIKSHVKKTLQILNNSIPLGKDELHLHRIETNEYIGFAADNGRISIIEGNPASAHSLSAQDMSELFFGPMDKSMIIAELSAHSPLNTLWQLPVSIPSIYAL